MKKIYVLTNNKYIPVCETVEVFSTLEKCVDELIELAAEECWYLDKKEIMKEARKREKERCVYIYIFEELGYSILPNILQ